MKDAIKKVDNFIEKCMYSSILQWIMVVFASIVFGILCFGRTIWLDEAITGTFIRLSYMDLIITTAADVHPPLYYLIVKTAILLLGDHMWVVKLFSYIPFVLTLLVVRLYIPKMLDQKITFLSIVLLCITPCIIRKHAEMRMYAWAMFFVFIFAISLYNGVMKQNKRDYSLGIFMGICAAYTHYYALIAVAAFYVYVFLINIKKKYCRKKLYMAIIISSILYFPWLLVLLNQTRQISENGWWNEFNITLKSIMFDYLSWPFADGQIILQILFLIAFVLAVINIRKNRNKVFAYGCLLPYLSVVLVGVLITVFFEPVFISRFLYPCVGLLLLGIAIWLSSVDSKIVMLILMYLFFFGMKTYNSQIHYCYAPSSIANLDNFMEKLDKSNSVFICNSEADKVIVEYLYPSVSFISDKMVTKENIEGKEVYYLVCADEEQKLQNLAELGIEDFQQLTHIYVKFSEFDIYKLKNNL